MIKKFIAVNCAASQRIITFKIAPDDSYEYTWDTEPNPVFAPGAQSFTEHLNWMLSQGWKQVAAGMDPNDYQNICAHVYDSGTDSCQLCKRHWDSILWDSPGKPCCSGGLGAVAAEYRNGKWHSKDCDTLKPPQNIPAYKPEDYRAPNPKKGLCTCGSAAVGSDKHSYYCDILK